MFDVVADALAELGAVALFAAGSGLLTLAGVIAEYEGLQHLLSGDAVTGLWFAYMGGVALFAGSLVLRRKLLPRVSRRSGV